MSWLVEPVDWTDGWLSRFLLDPSDMKSHSGSKAQAVLLVGLMMKKGRNAPSKTPPICKLRRWALLVRPLNIEVGQHLAKTTRA